MAKYTIALDAGHGENTYRETGSKGVPGLRPMGEHGFNATVVKYAKELAEDCGIDVLLTQPLFKRDVPLITRTNLANAKHVDLLMSFHADANQPAARGHWGFYWHTSADGKRLANLWGDELSKATGTHNRGSQASKPNYWTNFHMVRETHMVAVLMEHAFMTNAQDLELIKSDAFRRQCAEAAIRAVCRYFGIPYRGKGGASKPAKDDGLLERGDSGAKVTDLQKRLNALGYDAGKADGDFGPNTEKAVKAFQKAAKLSVDGIAGPNTLKALGKAEDAKEGESGSKGGSRT